MSYKKYLSIVTGAAVIGWTSWILVITKLDPCTAPGEITICHSISALSIALFFLSAFFALTATFTLMGFGLRLWLHHNEIYLDHFTVSLRQGLLLTFCAMGAMLFLLLKTLTWWSGLLLIAIILLIELYFARPE
ncbi:MAG: hypothetical protein UY05_C0035G0002 [Candidatus Peregrinibacteria bacterium GW2011_GWA2_47_7]|nr:MAG: hypothetical protein UY05_C0035G0002 [Candidatus Peregrinibacteria bacterium GW2011_GWA2_47_7]